MMQWLKNRRLARVLAPAGSLLLLGQCGLNDAQLASVGQSVITTGLNAFVQQILATFLSSVTAAA